MPRKPVPKDQLCTGSDADKVIAACRRNRDATWAEIAAILRPQIRPWPDGSPRGIFR